MATKKRPTCKPKPIRDYGDAVEDANRRLRAGEKQKRCTCCGFWRWPHEKPVE